MELMSLKQAPKEFRFELLRALDLNVDQNCTYVLGKDGSPQYDRYMNTPIRFDNFVIFPGSTILLDDNPLSIASYFEEFGEPY